MPVTIKTDKVLPNSECFHFSLMGDDFLVMFSPLKKGNNTTLVLIIGSNIVCVYTYSYTQTYNIYMYIHMKHIYVGKFC